MTTTQTPGAARYAAYLHRRWLWRRGLDRTLAGIMAATDARATLQEPQEGRDGGTPPSGASEPEERGR